MHIHSVRSLATPALLLGFLTTLVQCGGCGSGSSNAGSGGGGTPPAQVAEPTISTTKAQNDAVVVTLNDTTPSATIYYTLDGTPPTSSSPQYLAPFLLASSATLKTIALAGGTSSSIATQSFSPSIASGTLVWSDEFSNSTSSNAQPDPGTWAYDTGAGGWGNQELETYCAAGSSASPCDNNNPNAYVGTDGYLHIAARNPSAGVYTSARLKTQGLFSLMYGRVEARIKLPEGQGLWPAFWLLGNNIATINWPACGEQDVMEHINSPNPDWIAGSVHGTGLNLSTDYTYNATNNFSASDWHVYGMIWSKGSVQFYVDSPTNIYATYTPSSEAGSTWPFDSGGANFIILNLAIGGSWPGSPDGTTVFPAEMLVDYVRVYAN